MNIGSIIMKPLEISAKFFGASAELIDTYKYYSKLKIIRCLYFNQNDLRIIRGELSKDGVWITPKDINKKFRRNKLYKDSKGDVFAVIVESNPQTIDLLKKPTLDEGTKSVIKYAKDEKGNVLQTVSLEPFNIIGGDILSSVAYDIGRFTFIKWLQTQSRGELIYYIVIAILIGIIIGIIQPFV